jgi:hypothetical protein
MSDTLEPTENDAKVAYLKCHLTISVYELRGTTKYLSGYPAWRGQSVNPNSQNIK